MMVLAVPEGIPAVLLTVVCSFVVITLIRQNTEDSQFLTQVFLGGLIVRLAFGIFIHTFDLRAYFGGDSQIYDISGDVIKDYWLGSISGNDLFTQRVTSTSNPSWGMNYFTAVIYMIVGRNILAAQSICAVIGAATAPMVYVCANNIFNNRRVGKVSALLVAFFPAFIIWSGQLLKDGLVIFLLVLAIITVLQLQQKLSYLAVAILIFSLFGIISLRFYIFFMVAASVAGSFIVGQTNSIQAVWRRLAVLLILGLGLTYLGVLGNATEKFEKYGNLEQVEITRKDLARSAKSGFGEDVDVSTTEGAITAIPVGLAYLMLAPFPWQMGSLRQAFTLPEILVWWCSIPLIFIGLWYTVKKRLRQAIPILIFTVMLTLAYSIFQGNVGTAYRQRTQIQVFLFIFIAVGWTLRQEKKENKNLIRRSMKRPELTSTLK